MKNKPFFIKQIKESSIIRKKINTVHHKKMNDLSTLFNLVFDRDGKEFIYAKNILYYTGGWPAETTPPRAQSLANNIANAYVILSYLDMDQELNKHLGDRGLQIVVTNNNLYRNYFKTNITDSSNNTKYRKALKLWKGIFGTSFINSPKEFLRKIMSEALDEQLIICQLADQIKIDAGEEVKEKCDIKNVHNFTNLVNFQFNLNEGKDVDEKIENGKEKILESDECLETYKESL